MLWVGVTLDVAVCVLLLEAVKVRVSVTELVADWVNDTEGVAVVEAVGEIVTD